MATERFDEQGEAMPPDRPTRRLPAVRHCLACAGVMAPLHFWTSGADSGWGELRFGPRHPINMPRPMIGPGGSIWPGPVDVAPEVKVETWACTQCGRLDWYVVGPMPGDAGGFE